MVAFTEIHTNYSIVCYNRRVSCKSEGSDAYYFEGIETAKLFWIDPTTILECALKKIVNLGKLVLLNKKYYCNHPPTASLFFPDVEFSPGKGFTKGDSYCSSIKSLAMVHFVPKTDESKQADFLDYLLNALKEMDCSPSVSRLTDQTYNYTSFSGFRSVYQYEKVTITQVASLGEVNTPD